MRRIIITFLIFFSFCPGLSSGETVRGQETIMVIGDTFRFTQGVWSRYYLHDKTKNEYFLMKVSILERETREGKPCSWMEIEVVSEKNPVVVTRFLAEETREGPGDLKEVIVQVKGYAPFIVPENFYKGKDREVGKIKTARIAKHVYKSAIQYKGKILDVLKVDLQDQNSKALEALVSEEISPVGIVMVESSDIGMYLDDWGADARTHIEGVPLNFYLWLIEQAL